MVCKIINILCQINQINRIYYYRGRGTLEIQTGDSRGREDQPLPFADTTAEEKEPSNGNGQWHPPFPFEMKMDDSRGGEWVPTSLILTFEIQTDDGREGNANEWGNPPLPFKTDNSRGRGPLSSKRRRATAEEPFETQTEGGL